jgi:hypothetical protein
VHIDLDASATNRIASHIWVTLIVINGRAASTTQGVRNYRAGEFGSPLDLFVKWNSVWSRHGRWLGLSGEPVTWRSGQFTDMLVHTLT